MMADASLVEVNERLVSLATDNLIIGSAPGTLKDAKSVVASFIDRYCDIPASVYYRLIKNEVGGYHFEIQENPGSGSVIDELVNHFEGRDASDVVVRDANGSQYRIFQREDGTLRTFFLSEEDHVSQSLSERFEELQGSRYRLKAYRSTHALGVALSAGVFGVCACALIIALATWQLNERVNQGYSAAVDHSPLKLLIHTTPSDRQLESDDFAMLPLWEGMIMMNQFVEHRQGVIGKLEFKEGYWEVLELDPTLQRDQGEESSHE